MVIATLLSGGSRQTVTSRPARPARRPPASPVASEAEAREGERKEAQAVMEQLMARTPEPPDFIDLRQPRLYSPPAAGAGLPGPRESAEAAGVERST